MIVVAAIVVLPSTNLLGYKYLGSKLIDATQVVNGESHGLSGMCASC